MIPLVTQKDPKGCGIAALAMVLGCTYEEAWDDVAYTYGERPDLIDYGITKTHIERVLGERGYIWRTLYNGGRKNWYPEAFAPIHIVSVIQESNNSHFVVMLENDRILDPLGAGSRLSDWPKILNVMGIWDQLIRVS